MARPTRALAHRLLRERGELTSRELADEAGVSRQAASRQLRALEQEGVVVREGAARSTRYRLVAAPLHWSHPLAGLEEDRVWTELVDSWPALGALPAASLEVAQYALTEMVNNAIDHSGGTRVDLHGTDAAGRLAIDIADDGEGAYAHVCQRLGLATELEAVQLMSKGKLTTDPERHTGEGIFFSSKAVDFFCLESGRLRWVVDNEVGEHALFECEPVSGTRVRFEIDPASERRLVEVFEAYTESFEFVRTRVVVKLFEYGVRFVSRSEARRLLVGLERFSEVVMDFSGVDGVGQGFADEVFRVWAAAHPDIRLVPTHMNEVVTFVVERARRPSR